MKAKTGLMGGKATIYGTDWCGYTTKQKKAFDDKGIPYDYVNCDASPNLCKGIAGFPVVKGGPGKTPDWEGFKPL